MKTYRLGHDSKNGGVTPKQPRLKLQIMDVKFPLRLDDGIYLSGNL